VNRRLLVLLVVAPCLGAIALPGDALAGGKWAVRTLTGQQVGWAVVTNRARAEGKVYWLGALGQACKVRKTSVRTWSAISANSMLPTTVVRKYASAPRWRLFTQTSRYWGRVVRRQDVWAVQRRLAGKFVTVGTVNEHCPAPLAGSAVLWLVGG
jgi:hypothetical protein